MASVIPTASPPAVPAIRDRHQVSVVIPALNEAAGIQLAVKRAWDAGADEVIVVDGGSRDNTAELGSDAGAQVIISSSGRAAQQNAGARASRGSLLLFLHADCWLETGGVGQIRQAFGDEGVQLAAFRQRIDADGRLYRLLEQGNAWRARRGIPYGDQGISVRREIFLAQGGFPAVALMEDRLFSQAWRRWTQVKLLPGPLHVSARRWQQKGVIRQTARNWALISAVQLGVSPDRLARFYRPHAADETVDDR